MTERFDVSGLRFWRGPTRKLPINFAGVQDLRQKHYLREFGRAHRKPIEIEYFVDQLDAATFYKPQLAVGKTALKGQLRHKPMAAAAFDEKTGRLRSLVHGALNVSSRLEPILTDKLNVPEVAASPVGFIERSLKRSVGHQVVWTSEIISDEGENDIEALTLGLQLEQYKETLGSTIYPWTEEDRTKEVISSVGFAPKVGEERMLSPDTFGPSSSTGTIQEPWQNSMVWGVLTDLRVQPGAVAALRQAHESIAAQLGD